MGLGIVKTSWTTVILPPYSSSIILGYLIYRKTFTHSFSAVPTTNTELAKVNRKLKKDLADSYKEIHKWKNEIKMIPSRLDYSVSARRRLSTLREAHRDAALGLTTFSKADKIVAKLEGIILLPTEALEYIYFDYY